MRWRTTFDALGAVAAGAAAPGERWSLWLEAEDSDFVRFNRGRVRQAGTVHDASLTVRWMRDRRQASSSLTLTGDPVEDRSRLDAAILDLRDRLPHVPEDPHLLLPDAVTHSDDDDGGQIPDAAAVTRDVTEAARASKLDLVGFYAGGAMHRAYADSRGQRNWFTTHGHVFDWSLVHDRDKAVKQAIAGGAWNPEAFLSRIDAGRADLAALARPARRLAPGSYRSFLSPDAVGELLELVSGNGFSAREHQRRQSCLGRLASGDRVLDRRVDLVENVAAGVSPRFTEEGFVRPDAIPLVREGRYVGSLVGPRSAAEYGTPCNGSGDDESPVSLQLAGGALPMAEARAALGTGVWVSQLWYANFSDLAAGRMTGMTRFATLWVEDGEVVGPVDVMRFDDTIYELLGERLEALTAETRLLPSTATYHFRSTRSMRLPGVLVRGLTFTL